LDDDGLFPELAQLGADEAPDDVGGAARGKGDDDGDRPGWPVCGGSGSGQAGGKSGGGEQQGGPSQWSKAMLHESLQLCLYILSAAKSCVVAGKNEGSDTVRGPTPNQNGMRPDMGFRGPTPNQVRQTERRQ